MSPLPEQRSRSPAAITAHIWRHSDVSGQVRRVPRAASQRGAGWGSRLPLPLRGLAGPQRGAGDGERRARPGKPGQAQRAVGGLCVDPARSGIGCQGWKCFQCFQPLIKQGPRSKRTGFGLRTSETIFSKNFTNLKKIV